MKIRNFMYDKNIIKSCFFNDLIVLSVGNLTVGGTGKTPKTEYLVRLLKDSYKIAVLSRGYKRKSKGFRYVSPSDNYLQTGDEPLQIAKKYKDITVAVCKDRVLAIKKLKKEKNIDLIILDDSFQHRKLTPHFSILLTTYNNPYFNDIFLPVGRLRDNKSEYERADLIVVTKCPAGLKPIEKSIFTQNIGVLPHQQIFFATEKYLEPLNMYTGEKLLKPENLHLLAVTGIANSKGFINYLNQSLSHNIVHLNYKDHKDFSDIQKQQIIKNYEEISSSNKLIITTEKDSMRLRNVDFPKNIANRIYYLPIEMLYLSKSSTNFDSSLFNLLYQLKQQNEC